jgi:hypothetical protein
MMTRRWGLQSGRNEDTSQVSSVERPLGNMIRYSGKLDIAEVDVIEIENVSVTGIDPTGAIHLVLPLICCPASANKKLECVLYPTEIKPLRDVGFVVSCCIAPCMQHNDRSLHVKLRVMSVIVNHSIRVGGSSDIYE